MNRDPEHNGSYKRGDSDKGAPDNVLAVCYCLASRNGE